MSTGSVAYAREVRRRSEHLHRDARARCQRAVAEVEEAAGLVARLQQARRAPASPVPQPEETEVATGLGQPTSPDRHAEGARTSPTRGFTLEAIVDGRPVMAHWDHEGFSCDPLLLAQAQTVEALGDSFGGDGDRAPVAANLQGSPVAVLLTLMRACDRVVQVDVALNS